MPAAAEPAAPLVSPQWLKDHLSDPAIVVLDIRSAIDGGGAEAYAKGHIPGAVHSDYDKAGWRVTRNGVPFMLPTLARAGEADRRDRHRRGQPRRRRAGRRARHRLRLGGARLLDAQGRRPSGGVDPRRRLCRLAGGGLSGRDRHAIRRRRRSSPPSSTRACWRRSRCRSGGAEPARRDAGRCAAGELLRRQGKGAGRQGLWPHSGRAQSRQRELLRSARPTGCGRRPQLAAIAAALPAGPVVDLLQHRPLGGDRLVRAVGHRSAGRTCGSTTARWSNGPPTSAVRSRPRARAGTM